MSKRVIFFVIFIGICRSAMADCESFFDSTLVKNHIKNYNQIYSAGGVWDNYDPYNETVVFTDLKNRPTCALIITGGKQLAVSLKVPITTVNGIYGFYLAGSTEYQVSKELESILKSGGVTRASIYSLAPFPFPPSFPGYEQFIFGFNEIIFLMTLHESFHFNVQYHGEFSSSPYAWPEWDQFQPDLDELQKKCYFDPSVKEFTERELKTLTRAYKLASIYQQFDLAREAVKVFQELRKKRYLSLKRTTVSAPSNPNGISCEEAEARMELTEGSAEYLGLSSALKIGIIQPLQIADVSEFRWEFGTLYYSFGSLQLFLLSNLSAEPISSTTARIARSKTWDKGIGFEFSKL